MIMQPIFEKDAPNVGREFFNEDFKRSMNLAGGQWFGKAAAFMPVGQPIAQGEFQNLLCGKSPDGTQRLLNESPDPHRIVGWQCKFSLPEPLQPFWEMASSLAAILTRKAQVEAVAKTMSAFETSVLGKLPGSPEQLGGLFASFTCASQRRDHALLETTVVFINAGFRPDRSAERCPTAAPPPPEKQLKDCYQVKLLEGLHEHMGTVVPNEGDFRQQLNSQILYGAYAGLARDQDDHLRAWRCNRADPIVTITPIRPGAEEKAYQEFFRPDFATERHGRNGHWTGTAAEVLKLSNPVELKTFQNLLAGRTPDGSRSFFPSSSPPRKALGWRINISASPSVSLLWAMAPRPVRIAMEHDHAMAARNGMAELGEYLWRVGQMNPRFERSLSRNRDMDRWTYPASLFAMFRSGANQNRAPHLQTNMFLFNLCLLGDGTAHTHPTTEVLDYVDHLRRAVSNCFGDRFEFRYGQLCDGDSVANRWRGVPDKTCMKFISRPQAQTTRMGTAAVERKALYAEWGKLGTQWGWGPKEAQSLLRQARWNKLRHNLEFKLKTSGLARFVQHPKQKVQEPAQVGKLVPLGKQQSKEKDWGHSY